MPFVFYTEYVPSESPRENTAREHALGRELLSEALLDICSLTLLPEDIAVAETGKPYLPSRPDIHFNISHCKGLVACAVDRDPVGVDAERSGYFADILIKKVFTDSERELLLRHSASKEEQEKWFFRLWTLKEAYVKWDGNGLSMKLTSFSFTFTEDPVSGAPIPACSDPAVCCFQTALPSGHILSLCYTGSEKPVTLKKVTSRL